MKNLKTLLILISFLTFVIACSEDEDVPSEQQDTSASEDYSLADNLFENVSDVADQAEQDNEEYLEGGKSGSYLGTCVTITLDSALGSGSNKLTIDFDKSSCTGRDGRVRKGKVFVEWSGQYRDSGTVILTTFEDYFVDDHQLLGSRTVTNGGKNENNQTFFNIDVEGKVIKPNGGEVEYVSNRVRTWTAGESTQGPLLGWIDDEYEITGTASGTSSTGRDYEVEITKALEINLLCRWITAGTFELRPDGLAVREFDFGNGNCDPNASLTVNNITINFVMP
ncbi:MAG: hypothetical protein RH860_13055 [Cytophagales bacterium]